MSSDVILFQPRFISAYVQGDKHATVRKGRREYPRHVTLVDNTNADNFIRAEVLSHTYKQFCDLTYYDAVIDGYDSEESLKNTLKEIYPDIQQTDEVTIVVFRPFGFTRDVKPYPDPLSDLQSEFDSLQEEYARVSLKLKQTGAEWLK